MAIIVSRLGKRSVRHTQGSDFVTIPRAYKENFPNEEIDELEFYLADDKSLIARPITSEKKAKEPQAPVAPGTLAPVEKSEATAP